MKEQVYIIQFGTGANINLLPLAAGQLYSRCQSDPEFTERYRLPDIVFRREEPATAASRLERVAVAGLSCFLWNLNISMETAAEIRRRFPKALIVAGGPAVPKSGEAVASFFRDNPALDVICAGEGEEVFLQLCKALGDPARLELIPGIIFRCRETGAIRTTAKEVSPCLDLLPSPYLDGTFDSFYEKYRDEFSGICWETNRGCPYECTYCTWGNLASHRMRLKPAEQVAAEIEWMGTHRINYVAMADSNFGIMERDVEIAQQLAACRKKYGFPNFVSVSWAKHAPERVIAIGKLLKEAGIGFRVTLSLQSLDGEVIKEVKRSNYSNEEFSRIKADYHRNHFYSYTELILGLPKETRRSYLSGLEQSLSQSVFEQLYVYPLFLFPNTSIGSPESRERNGLATSIIPNRYTKSKETTTVAEYVEIVVGSKAMPGTEWLDAFVEGYYTLALHDSRLAFFVLRYLKREFSISITDLVGYARRVAPDVGFLTLMKSFSRLLECARGVQEEGRSHLIEPGRYGGIPYDPPDAMFLELLLEREGFYAEFQRAVCAFLADLGRGFDPEVIEDLFRFQMAVMAHPDGPAAGSVTLRFNWIDYFGFTFGFEDSPLEPRRQTLQVLDTAPSQGPADFLKKHFDVRGVPPFNKLLLDGKPVFPPEVILTSKKG